MTTFQKIALLWSTIAILAGCSVAPTTPRSPSPESTVSSSAASRKGGGYYLDDGPADSIPADIDKIPDAIPKLEAFHRFANRPYTVMGQSYEPKQALTRFTQKGRASWYGKKFHGRKTASGEPYNMFAMTAAHPTLPIPSYVRVINPKNNRHVIVRVNDRGPFHSNRIIDLSYTAAHRLGFVEQGSAVVEIEQIVFDDEGKPSISSAAALDRPDDLLSAIMASQGDQGERGAFVQVGAYRIRDNADMMGLNLRQHFDQLIGRTQVVLRDDLFRVWVGPFAARQDAVILAAQISDRYGFKAIVIDQ